MKALAAILVGAAVLAGTSQAATIPPSGPGIPLLLIVHDAKGRCVWSDGIRRSSTFRLALPGEGAVMIANAVPHGQRLAQTAGPRLRLIGTLRPDGVIAIIFRRVGNYIFTMRAIGGRQDNELRLTVDVR